MFCERLQSVYQTRARPGDITAAAAEVRLGVSAAVGSAAAVGVVRRSERRVLGELCA